MPNEFVVRNGVIALNNSLISGSSSGIGIGSSVLEVVHTGSVIPANIATFRNSVQNGARISIASTDRSFQIGVNGFADGGSIIGNLNISSGTPTLRLMNANETTTFLSLAANTTTGVVTATTSASSAPIVLQNNGLTTTGSLNVNGSITGSNILTTGTITAQTIVAQVITSSTDFVTGSTRFGSLLTNTHQFTGSVSVTGSLTSNGSVTVINPNRLFLTSDSTSFLYSAGSNQMTIGINASANSSVNIFNGGVRIGSDTNNQGFNILDGGYSSINSVASSSRMLRIESAGSQVHLVLSRVVGNFLEARSSDLNTLYAAITSTGGALLSGSVAIGKMTATSQLDVLGNVLVTGSVNINGPITSSGFNLFTVGNGFNFDSLVSSSTDASVRFRRGSDNGWVRYVLGNNSSGQLALETSTGELRLFAGGGGYFPTVYSNGVERIRITTGGNFLYNTTSSLGYDYDVNGTGNFRNNVTITGSLVVAPSSNRELVVSSTGINVGNVITDTHTITGSVRLSGSMEIGPTLSNASAQLLVTGTPTRTKGIIVSSSWDYQTSWAMWNGIYASEFNLGGATKNVSEGGPGSFQISLYNSSTAAFRYPITAYANGNVVLGGSSATVPADTGESLQVTGAGKITGGLTVTGSLIAPTITGSLQGTASWALNVVGGGGVSTGYLNTSFDGLGSVILINTLDYYRVPKAGTITGWSVVANGTWPTMSFDVWVTGSGGQIPTVNNSICGGNFPFISGSVNSITSSNLTGWTTSFAANSVFGVNVRSSSLATKASLLLNVTWS